jgi:dTMP kinase
VKKYNKFITFEGVEGSGKSTILKMVMDHYGPSKVFITREPGGKENNFSEDVRNIIMNNVNISDLTELLLFESARSNHVENTILPALNNELTVICDRYTDSSLVYQGMNGSVGYDRTLLLNEIATNDVNPSLTILFDIDPVLSLKRITNDREINKFDEKSIEFHQNIRKSYLELASIFPERIKIIDASLEIDIVFKQVIELLEENENNIN